MNDRTDIQSTKASTREVEMKYEDVDDTGSRLPVGRNAPGEHHRPRGPGAPSKKESIEIKFVTGSVDSGRDVGPAADGAASGTRARNFTLAVAKR